MKAEYARNLCNEINDAIAGARIHAMDNNFGLVCIDSNVTISIYKAGHITLEVDNSDMSGLYAHGDTIMVLPTAPFEGDCRVSIEMWTDGQRTMTYYLSDETHMVLYQKD